MTLELQPQNRFTAPQNIMAKNMDGGVVLLDLNSGAYVGMTTVGTHIWQLYSAGLTLQETIDGVCRRFEVEAARAEEDTKAFTQKLLDRGFLRIAQ